MDKTVRLWHISRRECLCCFQHIDFVTAIAFHPRVSWVTFGTNHTSINFVIQTIYSNTLFHCFPGWQILFKRLSGRETTAVEHSRQEGGAVERGGRPNTTHHCSQLLPKWKVRCYWYIRWSVHLLWHRGNYDLPDKFNMTALIPG